LTALVHTEVYILLMEPEYVCRLDNNIVYSEKEGDGHLIFVFMYNNSSYDTNNSYY